MWCEIQFLGIQATELQVCLWQGKCEWDFLVLSFHHIYEVQLQKKSRTEVIVILWSRLRKAEEQVKEN